MHTDSCIDNISSRILKTLGKPGDDREMLLLYLYQFSLKNGSSKKQQNIIRERRDRIANAIEQLYNEQFIDLEDKEYFLELKDRLSNELQLLIRHWFHHLEVKSTPLLKENLSDEYIHIWLQLL